MRRLISQLLLTCAVVVATTLLEGTTNASLIAVTPSQFSGTSASFTGDALGGSPPPYGFSNNASDVGWIWYNGDNFTVDFLTAEAVDTFRVWSVYAGGERGATWEILSSDNGTTFTHETNFTYDTSVGGGVNDDNSTRSDYAGWYSVSFNVVGNAHRYWQVLDAGALVNHSPRSAEVQFFSQTATVPEPSSFALLSLGGIGSAIGAYRRRLRASV